MIVYLVYTDDCNEEDCGCYIESVDSVWLDKNKALERAKGCFNGYIRQFEIKE